MTSPDAAPPNPTPPSQPLTPSALYVPLPPPHHDSEAFLRTDRHRTAQELEDIPHGSARNSSRNNSQRRLNPSTQPSHRSTATDTSSPEARRWYDGVTGFWASNVSVTISEGAHRDHLALERTFLGYLRTSLALAITGVITAQLFRLQHTATPNPRIGFFVLGVPLAAAFIALGMLVLVVGAVRFWRQQRALVRGRVWAGGWEIVGVMGVSLAITAVTFAMLVWVDVEKG
ncbi:hypothetical protein P171DRAFT_523047 [Karstenula rhodostoma CBS 690.94]|uniref:DUF202 domain-containing protein n=1 Tax=Karstenula rhodostoma CBS 690.94 TaxID=1392251 RepID=A0A9P4UAK4_9PLEO|nr:hypothetical protein P171DRAFT_523047 [Karstenula rhodostoma CBS 690.94]